jgi:hypothetical protein
VGEADPLEGRLDDPAELGRGLDPQGIKDGGTMSMAWAYWLRTSPLAWIPAGQWTMMGSLMPPR